MALAPRGFRVPRLAFRVSVVRLQKFLAEAGVASRRASEAIIQAGRVQVNGVVVRQLGTKVDSVHDQVTLDGKPVHARRKLYVALHKPPGCVCSRKDEAGRATVYDLLPKEWRNLHSVGRLAMVRQFTQGVWHTGERLKAERARLLSASNARSVVELELAEGKNREVRRLFESQGRGVERLVRIQIGKLKLGELPSGKWRTLTEPEIKTLMTTL